LALILPGFNAPIEAVSARALAPLPQLIDYAEKFLAQGAVGVFPRGKLFEAEGPLGLTAGKYLITTTASQTDPAARLVLVRRRP
jgi:16S rRNA (guanine527-N7)-methyltransferase